MGWLPSSQGYGSVSGPGDRLYLENCTLKHLTLTEGGNDPEVRTRHPRPYGNIWNKTEIPGGDPGKKISGKEKQTASGNAMLHGDG